MTEIAGLAKQLRGLCGKDCQSASDSQSALDLQNAVQTLSSAHAIDPILYINVGNANNKTALHFASQYRDEDMVQWLIRSRADVNAYTSRGQTALIFASGRGQDAIVSLLLEAGARCRVRTAHGFTALSSGMGRLSQESLSEIQKREHAEQDWLDFTVDKPAIEAQANHLHMNPRLLQNEAAIPTHLAIALKEHRDKIVSSNCYSRQRLAALSNEQVPIELPTQFQTDDILAYDASIYNFGDVVKRILNEECDLASLHRTLEGQCISAKFKDNPNTLQLGPRDNIWNQRFLSARHSDGPMRTFRRMLEDFLRTYVLPDLGTQRIAYQKDPTFRCHLPYTGAVGRPHRDEDYGHPWSEINYWIPLTRVSGSNSLFRESACGSGDFQAFEADVGHAVRFWGNQVWHFTKPNETQSTRVSFDIRVIREEEWSPQSFHKFHIGEYYDIVDASGPVTAEVMALLKQTFNGSDRESGKQLVEKPTCDACTADSMVKDDRETRQNAT